MRGMQGAGRRRRPHERTIDVNGVSLAYETLGAEDAAPLLLIQGLGAQMIGWRDGFCVALAERGHFVVRFDNRDVGGSSWCDGVEYKLGDMADDAAALIEALGIQPAHVVGQSLGGMIAQELVLRHPDAVRSLCLLYTAPSFTHTKVTPEYRAARTTPASSRADAIEQMVENERRCASSSHAFDEAWNRALAAASFDRGYNPQGVDRQFRAGESAPDRTEALAAVEVPALIVHGDADQLIDVSGSHALAQAIPHAELQIFPGMGHELPAPLWPTLVELITGNAVRADEVAAKGLIR
jgi:pimeloyl-ACP methyl ester carboxylesterase